MLAGENLNDIYLVNSNHARRRQQNISGDRRASLHHEIILYYLKYIYNNQENNISCPASLCNANIDDRQ